MVGQSLIKHKIIQYMTIPKIYVVLRIVWLQISKTYWHNNCLNHVDTLQIKIEITALLKWKANMIQMWVGIFLI